MVSGNGYGRAGVTTVSNSGPLIALAKLGHLELLNKLYGKVVVPHEVHEEVVVNGYERGSPDAEVVRQAVHHGWLAVSKKTAFHRAVSQLPLHDGEKAVLSVALFNSAELLLMDDLLSRRHAVSLNFSVKGTLGVLVSAYRSRIITIDDLSRTFFAIEKRQDIWLSGNLCRQVLERLYSDETLH